MSFIESISNYSAKKLASKVPNDKYPTVEDQIQVFEYGFMVIWGAIFKGIIMISLASILGVFIPAMIIMFTFSSLRIIAGGFHFSDYTKCITFSTIQFIGVALIVKHSYQYFSQTNIYSLLFFCTLIGLYIMLRYAPRDTPNKPITEVSEIKKFKKWSLYYLISWIILMTISLFFSLKIIIISSCFGLLLELFSISKVGYVLYSLADNIKINK